MKLKKTDRKYFKCDCSFSFDKATYDNEAKCPLCGKNAEKIGYFTLLSDQILGWKCPKCNDIRYLCPSCKITLVLTKCTVCGYDSEKEGKGTLDKITILGNIKIFVIFHAYMNIFLEKLNLIGKKKTSIFENRLKICHSCEGFNKKTNKCGYCGCPILPKTRGKYKMDKDGLSINGCPFKKW